MCMCSMHCEKSHSGIKPQTVQLAHNLLDRLSHHSLVSLIPG